jgi:hypothetical protein
MSGVLRRRVLKSTYQCSQACQHKRNEEADDAPQEPDMGSPVGKTQQEETDRNLDQHNSDTDSGHVHKTPLEELFESTRISPDNSRVLSNA